LCLATRWPRWIKVTMVIVVSLFYVVAWDALSGMLGWPSPAELPKRFVLLAVVTEEPNRDRGSKGQIFVWVNALEGNKPVAEPRAYRLPYEKDLHSLFDEAMKKARKGITQLGSSEPQPEQKGSAHWLRPGGSDKAKITVRDMPAVQLPEK
jgi:hypothetical protein